MKTQFKKTLCMKSPMTCQGISSPVKEKRRVIAVLCEGLGARPLGGAPRQSDGKVPAGCGGINQCFLNKIFTSLCVSFLPMRLSFCAFDCFTAMVAQVHFFKEFLSQRSNWKARRALRFTVRRVPFATLTERQLNFSWTSTGRTTLRAF